MTSPYFLKVSENRKTVPALHAIMIVKNDTALNNCRSFMREVKGKMVQVEIFTLK